MIAKYINSSNMKAVEKTLVIFVLISIIYKYFHGLGSSMLLIVSMNLLAILYFYLSFALFNNINPKDIFKKASYANTTKRRISFAIVTGMALSISILGILFKIQDFPGADLLLIFGMLISLIITVVSLWKNNKDKGNFFSNILVRSAVVTIFILILLRIPERKLLEWQYPNYPDYVEAVIKASNSSDNDSLWENVKIEREKMQAAEDKE